MAALPALSPEALDDPVEPWTTNHRAGLWGQARALQAASQPRLPWSGLTFWSCLGRQQSLSLQAPVWTIHQRSPIAEGLREP